MEHLVVHWRFCDDDCWDSDHWTWRPWRKDPLSRLTSQRNGCIRNTSRFTLSKLLVLNAVLYIEIHAYSACVYVYYVDWVRIMMINFFSTAHAFQVGYIWETSKRYERTKCKNAERNLRKPCLTVAHPPQLDSQVSHSQSPSNDSEWLIYRNASLQYDGILNMYILHIYIYV